MAIPAIIYIVSGVFGGLFIISPFFARGKNSGIMRWCFMLTIFCMWIFWLVVASSQINPLIGPSLTNYTIAWIAEKWGDKAN